MADAKVKTEADSKRKAEDEDAKPTLVINGDLPSVVPTAGITAEVV